METIACEGFFKEAGWHCAPVAAGNSTVLYISTPITLVQGKPLDFFLLDRGALYEITDDGTTMGEFRATGLALEHKKNWKGLENIATAYGFSLDSSGEFTAVFPKNQLADWSGKVLLLFSALAAWEKEKLNDEDQDFALADEIELLLRAKAPSWALTRNTTITVGKSTLKFDFVWGNYLVDAVRPIAQSVNPKLRKALLLTKHSEDRVALFIIDDRSEPERADDEQSVLGQVAKAVKLSNFQKYFHA